MERPASINPVVSDSAPDRGEPDSTAWEWCQRYVRSLVSGGDERAVRRLIPHTIKGFDRHHGADRNQLHAVLASLDQRRPVAMYGWWPVDPTSEDVLGVDVMDVLPPDRKNTALVHGHAVVLIGYVRHDAFAGGGYVMVRDPGPAPVDGRDEVRYVPFAFVRTYATTLVSARLDGGRASVEPSDPPTPVVGPRHPTDVHIARKARCADPRSSYTDLFFSENVMDTARAKAICSRCEVRELCLARALERREPYGVWGGEFLVDGEVVAVKRGRGRPRRIPVVLHVDEITGMPIVA